MLGGTLTARPDTKISNKYAFNSNAFSSFASSLDDASENRTLQVTNELVYTNFVEAIGRSLAYILAMAPGWSLLNSTTAVNELSIGISTFDGPSMTETASFDIRWDRSGTLTARAVCIQVSKLHRLSDFTSSEEPGSFPEISLLLLPLGIKSAFCCIERRGKRRHRSPATEKVKHAIRSLLTGLGHHVPKNTDWIRVKITRNGIGNNSISISEHSPSEPVETLWPIDYCLCRNPQTQNLLQSEDPPFPGNLMDPIERAEAWFDGRFDRAKALEARKQQIEIEARRVRTHEQAHEQDVSDVLSPLSVRPGYQDASGVYPTPPDGLPFQAQDTPKADDDHQFEKNTDALGVLRETSYDDNHDEDDEPFRDQDMDLGITEDDFAFFDEPGPEDTSTTATNASQVEKLVKEEEKAEDMASNVPPTPKAEKHTSYMMPTAFPQAMIHIPEMRLQDGEHLFNNISSTEDTPAESIVYLDESYDRNQPPESNQTVRIESVPPEFVSRASHNDESSDLPNFGLDDKYTTCGRFGFNIDGTQSPSDPTARVGKVEDELPKIGLLEGSVSDIEEFSDSGEHF